MAVRHLFPGGNTSLGFFSYYSNILTQEEANRIFVIKGGPGVGKSTFMKRIGSEMEERGYDVEYLHCSSDNNSLDGVRIPKLKIAFLDGTAPHVVDPKNPGAVDEILNFGDFWNEEGIVVHKDEIIKTNKEIGYIFGRAYKYLKAALAVYEQSEMIYSTVLNKGKINKLTNDIINELFYKIPIAENEGKLRSMFISAMTPNGLCNYLDSVLTTDKVYEFKGGMGTGEDKIFEKVKDEAIARGYYVEAYYCPMNPYKIEHLVIPDLNVSFTTTNRHHTSKIKKTATVNMKYYMDKNILDNYNDDLEKNQKEFDRLLKIALDTISKAKALHDKLETYYIPNVSFEKIDKFFEEVMNRILK